MAQTITFLPPSMVFALEDIQPKFLLPLARLSPAIQGVVNGTKCVTGREKMYGWTGNRTRDPCISSQVLYH